MSKSQDSRIGRVRQSCGGQRWLRQVQKYVQKPPGSPGISDLPGLDSCREIFVIGKVIQAVMNPPGHFLRYIKICAEFFRRCLHTFVFEQKGKIILLYPPPCPQSLFQNLSGRRRQMVQPAFGAFSLPHCTAHRCGRTVLFSQAGLVIVRLLPGDGQRPDGGAKIPDGS